MDTTRGTGMPHHRAHNKPIFSPADLLTSADLLDQLAGRLKSGKVAFDTAGTLTNAHVILPASARRIALQLIGPNSGRVSVSHEPGLTIDQGITLTSTSGQIMLTAKDVGDAISREWYAIYAGSAGVVSNWSSLAAGASGASLGVVDTFTAPAGGSAVLLGASVSNFTGAPSVTLELTHGSTTVQIATFTASGRLQMSVALQAGDTIAWVVTTAVAATTFDTMLSGTQIGATVAPSPMSWVEVFAPDNL